ncbi:MAG: PQQ-binding-like beta-propeller repeat protein [Chitinophagaceae bacterium]|nr:PQQ-binding-like beta-propeller repeat protein [Chitinophagaceae bacterium]
MALLRSNRIYSSVNALNYSNGLIIANTCGGHLYGIEPSGNIKWEYLSNYSCYHNNPAIANKIIYVVDAGGKFSAVNITTGTEVWSKTINEYTENATPVYNNGMLFMARDYENKMYAFDAANGTLKHTYTLSSGQYVNVLWHRPSWVKLFMQFLKRVHYLPLM